MEYIQDIQNKVKKVDEEFIYAALEKRNRSIMKLYEIILLAL